MDYHTGEVKEVFRKAYSEGLRSKVNCYGANDVTEGVAIMWKENVDVSITGNSTNPTRFQHPVAGTYKKECIEKVRNISLLHQAAVPDVLFTLIIWRQDQLLTA